MKRDAIFGTIEQYRRTWERLEALGREIGNFERAHPGLKDYPRLTARSAGKRCSMKNCTKPQRPLQRQYRPHPPAS